MMSLRFFVVLLCICLLAGVQGAPECYESMAPGRCRGFFPRYYFDEKISKCILFAYGGCGGNRNNFETLEDCERTCSQCHQPKKIGRCRGYFQRYYFNKDASRCEIFFYGGCDANLNNFNTKEECEIACVIPQCLQPKKVGRCRAYFPRYYFNTDTSRCEEFIYGGCQANRNNFETREDCETACMG